MATKIKQEGPNRKGAKQPQLQAWEGEGKQQKTFVSLDMLASSGPRTQKRFTPYLSSPANGNIFSYLKDNTDGLATHSPPRSYNQICPGGSLPLTALFHKAPANAIFTTMIGAHAKLISPFASCTRHHWPRCQPLRFGTGIQSSQGGGLEITSKRGAHYTWEGTGLLRPIQKPTLVPDHESINKKKKSICLVTWNKRI